ncbi:MAG: YggT family protein [Christensenellales bacterium]|jgi:uncharacterized protein YggT (Ycf19 family)
MYLIYQTFQYFFRILELAIIGYVILSWIAPRSTVHQFLARLIEPAAHPFRVLNQRLLGRFNLPIDFTMLFLLIAIGLARQLLLRIYIALL